MEFIVSLVIWAFVIMFAITFAQFIIGIVIYVVVGIIAMIFYPLNWIYKKVKGE